MSLQRKRESIYDKHFRINIYNNLVIAAKAGMTLTK